MGHSTLLEMESVISPAAEALSGGILLPNRLWSLILNSKILHRVSFPESSILVKAVQPDTCSIHTTTVITYQVIRFFYQIILRLSLMKTCPTFSVPVQTVKLWLQLPAHSATS